MTSDPRRSNTMLRLEMRRQNNGRQNNQSFAFRTGLQMIRKTLNAIAVFVFVFAFVFVSSFLPPILHALEDQADELPSAEEVFDRYAEELGGLMPISGIESARLSMEFEIVGSGAAAVAGDQKMDLVWLSEIGWTSSSNTGVQSKSGNWKGKAWRSIEGSDTKWLEGEKEEEQNADWTSDLVGKWMCDVDKTVEAVIEGVQLSEDQLETMKSVLPGISVEISADTITLKTEIDRLSDEKKGSYKIESSDEEAQTFDLEVTFGDEDKKKGEVTLLSKKSMKLEFEDGGVLVFLKVFEAKKK